MAEQDKKLQDQAEGLRAIRKEVSSAAGVDAKLQSRLAAVLNRMEKQERFLKMACGIFAAVTPVLSEAEKKCHSELRAFEANLPLLAGQLTQTRNAVRAAEAQAAAIPASTPFTDRSDQLEAERLRREAEARTVAIDNLVDRTARLEHRVESADTTR